LLFAAANIFPIVTGGTRLLNALLFAPWGGRTVPDKPRLREQARDAIRARKMPTRSYDRMFGGPGSEQPCAVCGKTLPGAEVEIELEFNRHGATPGIERFHLHRLCYAAWEFERSEVG
jgi:hypothetical protein